ncbi:ABC-type sugar transport system ATPase subunit/ribose/xylose/arabinose/galactoside ABC-type transport system permease subunit [Microbacterium sp. BE35]|uniref:ATP-binding cassette domain-containing protein n=1 Tax=Microbacterium sp. BE35 TaxID=2817773 RepID=UPI0028571152|nr:ATP-binding cassette domain-containing protein [Microbacterium sp. BE35]MDR7188207.1 ABC-type sugar transport system ATPase subunit/ribose/xylose/arabinose/galactoside ABC-type transport system permease subunit [Microbacterium sp. BE35]
MFSELTGAVSAAPEATPPAVRMVGITKRFGQAVVLDGVDLTVRPGEVHALMGENGAGKSTLLKTLVGEVRPDSGTILLGEEPIEVKSVRDARDRGIAIVHQELSVIENLSVAENLFLGREPRRAGQLDRQAMLRQSKVLLARLGLHMDPDTPVFRLDVAERQAIEICAALAQNARVLILDEPTAALTETERLRLYTVIEQLRDEGLAIIYVSHHLTEIERLADRVTVLRNGHVVLCTSMEKSSASEIVFAMLGEPVEELFPDRASGTAAQEEVFRADAVSYGRRLSKASLAVRRGEIVGVTGLLGSGHRELGRVAAGVLRPTGGTISRSGRVVRFAPGDRKGEGLALGRSGIENLTVHDLRLASWNLGFRFLSRVRESRLASTWSGRLGVAGDITEDIALLSGGNQQKILVGRNIDGRADFLVLEEPTRGVDVGARQELYQLIRAEADRGAGVLVVSTDLREIAGLCDRVEVLNHGRTAASFDSEVSEAAVYEASHSEAPLLTTTNTVVVNPRDAKGSGWRSALQAIVSDRSFVPWLAFFALVVLASIGSERFLSAENFQNLARQSVTVGLVGLGEMLVVLTGNVDLSVGAITGLSNLVSAELLMQGVPVPLALAATLALGAVIGLVNALLVRFGMPSLLATFAMASVLRGIIVWRYPNSIGPVPKPFQGLDSATILGVPTVFLLMLVVFGIVGLALKRTPVGLHMYAVGGDLRASRLSGIRTNLVVSTAFVASGMFASLAGFHLSARLGAGLPSSGVGLELDALAVVVIGGVAILGGAGNVRGLLAGVGIVVVLGNLMNLTGLDAFLQMPIKGAAIILVAVVWGIRQKSVRRRASLGLDLSRRPRPSRAAAMAAEHARQ